MSIASHKLAGRDMRIVSHRTLKSQRQAEKLDLAAFDRAAQNSLTPGRYAEVVEDLTELPTQYPAANNTDPLIDNDNTGGLKPGRPWAAP